MLVSLGVCAAAGRVVTVGAGKKPCLASDQEGRLHLAYQGPQAGHNIYYRQSSDGGQTWSEESNVSNTPDVSNHPSIAAAGNRVAVAWVEDCQDHSGNDIYLATSADAGKTWGQAMDVSKTPGISHNPAVAVGPNGSIHLAWADTSDSGKTKSDIFYASSDNGGASWTKHVDVSKTHGVFGPPSIAVGWDGLVHIVWSDYCSGPNRPDVHVVRGMQDTWSKPMDISHSNELSAHPKLALGANGTTFVTWLEDCSDHSSNDIYFAQSREGSKYTRPHDLSHTPGISSDPSVVADNRGHVTVTWVDTTTNPKAPDIWQAQSQDAGRTFSRSRNVSHTAGVFYEFQAAMVGERAAVAWEEVWQGRSWIKFLPVPALESPQE